MSAPEIAGLIDEARLRGTAVKLAATVRSAGVTTAITYEVRVGTSICENAALVSNSKSTRIKLDENAAPIKQRLAGTWVNTIVFTSPNRLPRRPTFLTAVDASRS
jgi:hypothetical protein